MLANTLTVSKHIWAVLNHLLIQIFDSWVLYLDPDVHVVKALRLLSLGDTQRTPAWWFISRNGFRSIDHNFLRFNRTEQTVVGRFDSLPRGRQEWLTHFGQALIRYYSWQKLGVQSAVTSFWQHSGLQTRKFWRTGFPIGKVCPTSRKSDHRNWFLECFSLGVSTNYAATDCDGLTINHRRVDILGHWYTWTWVDFNRWVGTPKIQVVRLRFQSTKVNVFSPKMKHHGDLQVKNQRQRSKQAILIVHSHPKKGFHNSFRA